MHPFFKKASYTILTSATVFALISCSGQDKTAQAATNDLATPAPTSAPVLVTGLPDFTKLVDHISPAVVNIRTTETVQARNQASGQDPICVFFPDFPPCLNQPQQAQPQAPSQERTRGIGSGFIISKDGYILTNHHVIEGSSSITVSLNDKREFKATVVGSDPRTDVAVLKIEGTDLPILNAANSDDIKVGQWVMAAGSPFGLKNSVTAGIVSAINRDTGDYVSFIQTDAAVNPGNSGGPLVNMSGEVIGINSQILSSSGAFAGVALAIPINDALKVANQIRNTGSVNRGRIGVAITPVTDEMLGKLGLSTTEGVLIAEVEANSAAAHAGLRAGDVVLSIDGKAIIDPREFAHAIGESAPGTRFSLEVWRDKQRMTLDVTAAADTAIPA